MVAAGKYTTPESKRKRESAETVMGRIKNKKKIIFFIRVVYDEIRILNLHILERCV